MKLYGIAWRRNGQETNYWGRRSVLRRKNCAELLPRIITKSDLSALTTAETHLLCSSISGETERAVSSSVSLSLKRPAGVDCREKVPIHPFAFWICGCNPSSAKRGSHTFCKNRTP